MTVHFLQLTLPGGEPVLINVEQIVSVTKARATGKTCVRTLTDAIVVDETLEAIRGVGTTSYA
jgi:hypothetical protein